MSIKSKLTIFGLLIALLGLSLTTGPVISVAPQDVSLKQGGYLNLSNSSTVYYDYDEDSHSDAVQINTLINGTPNVEVTIWIQVYDTLRNYKSVAYRSFVLTLNSSGLAIVDYLFKSNFTSSYEFDINGNTNDDSQTYGGYWFTLYLDGNGMDWIPAPNINLNTEIQYQDVDNDGYNDTIVFQFELNEQNNPTYITYISANYSVNYYLGIYYHNNYNVPISKIYPQNNTFTYNFKFVSNMTANYDFNFVFADQYGRIVSNYYNYQRLDGNGTKYVSYNIYGWFDANYTASNGSDVIDSLEVKYNLQYDVGSIIQNDTLTVLIQVWALGDNWGYTDPYSIYVGNDGYFVASIKYNQSLGDQSFTMNNVSYFLLNNASNYLIVYSVYDPVTGFFWVNNTATQFVPVGLPPGTDPFNVNSVTVYVSDSNNDGLNDTIRVDASIESLLKGELKVYYYLDIQLKYQDGSANYVYGESRDVIINSPTNFTISISYSAEQEGEYMISWQLQPYPYMNNNINLYNETVYLHSYKTNDDTTTVSTTTVSNSTTNPNDTTTQDTSSESNSTTPELPLPFSFSSVILGIGSTSMLMLLVRKRR